MRRAQRVQPVNMLRFLLLPLVLLTACTTPEPAEGEGEGEDEFTCAAGADLDDGERACAVEDDCTILQVQTDCCGTLRFAGIANADAPAAQSDADACAAGADACDCNPEPPVADDGTSATFGTPAVNCIGGQCETTFEI